MASITQDLRFKQAVIEYSFKHGVTRAATRYKRTRQWIYFWRRRYDGERFYAGRKFYSLEDYNKQLKRYMNEYNNFPMRPLNWLSPNEYLASFFSKQSVTNV